MRPLIIFFSRAGENYVNGDLIHLETGNTERLVSFLREATDADVFRIEPEEPYPEDYMECTRVSKEEIRTGARPDLRAYLDSAESYDNIVVAFPIWWGTCPNIVLTQLERLNLRGKRIWPVITHEGSGSRKAVKALKKACPGARVMGSLAVHGAEVSGAEETVKAWGASRLSRKENTTR
ncbi:flavodoxin [Eubacterium pyruvativorans]|uniref:flavodoxin n=1 Tax=Eubacterium pyruvativorans TaxID=155865 RepID=UPI0013D20C22|nr:flavodoxin [Eubacterium pyruvativorans]